MRKVDEELQVSGLTPFVPAMDYELSRRFYKDLGFTESTRIDQSTLFQIPPFGFWLQDYYVEDWAGNFMMCLYVDDLASWWSRVQDMTLDANYGENAVPLLNTTPMVGFLLRQRRSGFIEQGRIGRCFQHPQLCEAVAATV